jgi:hypothetical protein
VIARTPPARDRTAADRARRGDRRKDEGLAGLVLESWTMQAPEAPRLGADGKVTAMAKYIATAASVALPPPAGCRGRLGRPALVGATAAKATPRSRSLSGAVAAHAAGIASIFASRSHFRHNRQQEQAQQRQLAQLTARAAVPSLPEPVPPVSRRIITLFCVALLALAPLRAAVRSKVNGSI